MEKFWYKLKHGFNNCDDNSYPTGNLIWDLSKKYIHTGLLETSYQQFNAIIPEIQLYIEIILQAGRDLHSTSEELRQDAKMYINSQLFDYDCARIGLNDEVIRFLLLKTVSNRNEINQLLNEEPE